MASRGRPKEKRAYEQGARAEAAAATADRILQATTELVMEHWLDEITLEQIAARAEVNVRTVLRRFHSRDDVVQAAVERFRTRLLSGPVRAVPPPGDVRATVRALMEYYERDALFLLRGLAQEDRFAFLQLNFKGTRARHRDWIAQSLAPQLAAQPPRSRGSKLDQLAAVTWVLTWKFLRQDSGLERADAERALYEIVVAVAGGP